MMRLLFAVFLTFWIAIPVKADTFMAPQVPASGVEHMPEKTDSFGDALTELIRKSLLQLRPDLQEAAEVCSVVILTAMLFGILPVISEQLATASEMAGAVAVSLVIFQHTNSMILLASETVREIFEYGKLLCQVMTAALAAQGGVTTSSALYIGTTVFISVLGSLISKMIIPMIYFFLAFAVANCALGDETLKKITDALKGIPHWLLKTLMIIFTTYMSVTGVVSGVTDLTALKSAKVVFSSAVPVVGGILADSSESVLTGMAVIKNAAGTYGIIAVLAIFVGPFLKIGTHYLMIKVSALICGALGNKRISVLAEHLSAAMSLLLAAVASGCVLVLISTVCFLKGTG